MVSCKLVISISHFRNTSTPPSFPAFSFSIVVLTATATMIIHMDYIIIVIIIIVYCVSLFI